MGGDLAGDFSILGLAHLVVAHLVGLLPVEGEFVTPAVFINQSKHGSPVMRLPVPDGCY